MDRAAWWHEANVFNLQGVSMTLWARRSRPRLPGPYVVGRLTPMPLWEALVILAIYALALWPFPLFFATVGRRWR